MASSGETESADLELSGEDCERCGASNAAAIVDGETLCGSCAKGVQYGDSE